MTTTTTAIIDKKFKLTECTREYKGKVLHRVQAMVDIPMYGIKAGDFGGWIEKEENLSQVGQCWVDDNATVYGEAKVYGNAAVFGYAEVYGTARVYDYAQVSDYAMVCGYTFICESAQVYARAIVYGGAQVFGYATVHGDAEVCDNAKVYGSAEISGNAKVYDTAVVLNSAHITGDAKVASRFDYTVFQNTWSSGRDFTYTKSNKMWTVGCFYGTGKELIEKAYRDSEMSGKCYEMYVNLVEQLEGVNNGSNGSNV